MICRPTRMVGLSEVIGSWKIIPIRFPRTWLTSSVPRPSSSRPSKRTEPLRLSIDRTHPVDPTDALLFHKTTVRERYEEAAERFPDADDVVLVNTRGEVTETTRANIAAKLDGRWVTPPLDAGLLPGCERAALIADGTLEESPISVESFADADEIAFLNSVRGWRRAELVD